MAILNTALTSTAQSIFPGTSGLTGNNAITTMIFCNTSTFNPATPAANTSLLYVYAVPSGGTAGPGNIIVNGLPIPAGETVSFDQEKIVLANGDFISAKTDLASNITATVSTLAV